MFLFLELGEALVFGPFLEPVLTKLRQQYDNADVYLNDYEKFRQLYIACSTTIKTLHSENQTLRQQKDVPVLDKYNKAGIDLFGESRVVWHDEPFPLGHLLPQEVIDYDRRLINEQSA